MLWWSVSACGRVWLWPKRPGLQSIAAVGLAGIPLHYVVLKRLLAIVETVRAGDPFVESNADSLQATAWALLALLAT